MTNTITPKLAAEIFGSFALVFAGTGAIVINNVTGGVVTHLGVSLTFGLIVLAMIYALGDVSGCHINPAVTIGFCLAGRFPGKQVVPYIICQLAGAILASIVIRTLFPLQSSLGATIPLQGSTQSFVLEAILSLILMFVILSVSTGAKEKGVLAGVAIGSVIALEALFAGPISGASMNPARSIAPALISMQFDSLWIYIVAPILGTTTSVLLCRVIRGPDCCANNCCI